MANQELVKLSPPYPGVCPDCEWFGRAQSCLASLQIPNGERREIRMAYGEIICSPRANSNLHVDVRASAIAQSPSLTGQRVYPLVWAELQCLKLVLEHPTQGFESV